MNTENNILFTTEPFVLTGAKCSLASLEKVPQFILNEPERASGKVSGS